MTKFARSGGFVPLLALLGCEMTEPTVEMATPNLISISYEAYATTPTLAPVAIDMAIEHCRKQGGLFANYKGVTAPNPMFSAKEIHTFACERVKTDDNIVISAQAERYLAQAALSAQIIANSTPTYTNCTTSGFHTSCTSY